MALRHLTVRIISILGCRHRGGSSTIIGQDRLLCYVGFRNSVCGFSLDDHLCGTPLWVLAAHPSSLDIYRPYLATLNRAVRTAVFRDLGVSREVQTTLDEINCVDRQLSLPAEFGGLNVPSLELDVEHAHYASFTATLANMIID
jgi:hypothetical protein